MVNISELMVKELYGIIELKNDKDKEAFDNDKTEELHVNNTLRKYGQGFYYIVDEYIKKVLGSNSFDESTFELIALKDGLSLNFESGETIVLTIDDDDDIHIEFNLENDYVYSDFVFYKFGFDGSLEYTFNGIDTEEIYSVRKGLFRKVKKENGVKVYSVGAKSMGYYRSDRASYDIFQEYPPVEYNGVIDRLQDFFSSHCSVSESQYGPSYDTYRALDNLLDIKLSKEKARSRLRVPKK
ncbi:MAG: hypothetical protein E7159_04600 [Firmicutes bacterium]|nr:hypothetical protein [Bacillota bacterium]